MRFILTQHHWTSLFLVKKQMILIFVKQLIAETLIAFFQNTESSYITDLYILFVLGTREVQIFP